MGYNREDYIRIKSEFSQKYILARKEAEERRFELHAKFPRVREIDSVLSRTGMDIMGVVTAGGNTNEGVARIRARNEKLISERNEILKSGGYSADYSDIHYECEKCGDTGFVDTKMCECMKRALVLAGYESSGIGALIKNQSFDNFSFDYYGSLSGKMRDTVARVRSFAESFNKDTYKNFLFIGGTGLGKTHLSTAVAKAVIDRGYDVLYVTSVGMIGDFEAKRFGDGMGAAGNGTERYTECDLLIIDDLGTEVANQFTLSCIYDVINARINARRCTVINTNLPAKEIEVKYNERIYSRLIGEYFPVLFAGTDIRKQKLSK